MNCVRAFALTEPEHGSDVAGEYETVAERQGNIGLSMVKRNGLVVHMYLMSFQYSQ